jgi:hypothetical protein
MAEQRHPTEQVVPPSREFVPAYRLVSRNRTPTVSPGGTVEIEMFLSGYGVPEKNKLHIQWSSPHVIDKKNPGSLKRIAVEPPTAPGRMAQATVIENRLDHLSVEYADEEPCSMREQPSERAA